MLRLKWRARIAPRTRSRRRGFAGSAGPASRTKCGDRRQSLSARSAYATGGRAREQIITGTYLRGPRVRVPPQFRKFRFGYTGRRYGATAPPRRGWDDGTLTRVTSAFPGPHGVRNGRSDVLGKRRSSQTAVHAGHSHALGRAYVRERAALDRCTARRLTQSDDVDRATRANTVPAMIASSRATTNPHRVVVGDVSERMPWRPDRSGRY